MPSTWCLVDHLSMCSLQGQIQNFLCMRLLFLIPLFGSKNLSNITEQYLFALLRQALSIIMFLMNLSDPGSTILASKGGVHRFSGSSGGGTFQTFCGVEPSGSVSHQVYSMRFGVIITLCMETFKLLLHKTECGKIFFKGVANAIINDLRKSTTCLCKKKWSGFLQWCHGQNINQCKATAPQIAKFSVFALEFKAICSYC